MAEQQRISRVRYDKEFGEPRYQHPNGWMIRRETRDWDARGYRGSAGNPTQKVSWVVTRLWSKRMVEVFDRLRDARAWCDTHGVAVSDG